MDSIGRQAAKEAVTLVFGLVGTIATAIVIKLAMKPDVYRESKMRAALVGKHFAQRQADRCQKVADYFATRYNEGKA